MLKGHRSHHDEYDLYEHRETHGEPAGLLSNDKGDIVDILVGDAEDEMRNAQFFSVVPEHDRKRQFYRVRRVASFYDDLLP